MKVFYNPRFLIPALSAGLSLLTLGCGGYAAREKSSIVEGRSTFVSGPSDPAPTPTPAPTVFPSPTPTGTPTPTPTNPPFSFRVDGTGYTSVTFEVTTRTVLKVRFAPGVQDKTVAGTGFSPQYSVLGVYIAVGSDLRPTPPLYNGLGGGTGEKSPVMDYSSAFTRTCSASDPDCREKVTITVKQPNYDYWCINYGAYCPWTHVWDTHPWNGTLTVQTDDTTGI